MAHWTLVTHIRPDTDTAWYVPSTVIMDKVEELKTSGKIISYEKFLSSDTLTKYYKIQFKTVDDSVNFGQLPECVQNFTDRDTYNNDNNITSSSEHFESIEPVLSGVTTISD